MIMLVMFYKLFKGHEGHSTFITHVIIFYLELLIDSPITRLLDFLRDKLS